MKRCNAQLSLEGNNCDNDTVKALVKTTNNILDRLIELEAKNLACSCSAHSESRREKKFQDAYANTFTCFGRMLWDALLKAGFTSPTKAAAAMGYRKPHLTPYLDGRKPVHPLIFDRMWQLVGAYLPMGIEKEGFRRMMMADLSGYRERFPEAGANMRQDHVSTTADVTRPTFPAPPAPPMHAHGTNDDSHN